MRLKTFSRGEQLEVCRVLWQKAPKVLVRPQDAIADIPHRQSLLLPKRVLPVMSTVSILSVSVSGGEADPAQLWPECEALGSWSDEGEPAQWEDM